MDEDDRLTEPLCANPQCKYHKYIVDACLRYVQVRPAPKPTEPIFVVDGKPPVDTHRPLTIERVTLFTHGVVRLGMYCTDCVKEITGKDVTR